VQPAALTLHSPSANNYNDFSASGS
jgi:hypothetical protein